MSGAELAALITALTMGTAAIITAIAALRNANANSKRVDDVVHENEKLKAELDDKTNANLHLLSKLNQQDQNIERYQQAFDKVGRQMNQMQLQLGAKQKHTVHDTAPLSLDKPPEDE